ncbi:Hypothetical protein D9617_21g097260 [Elsinoe fawcettii]|nr:Hypothetical protein D9617_21g097260 [Elsinoe fawcettii]
MTLSIRTRNRYGNILNFVTGQRSFSSTRRRALHRVESSTTGNVKTFREEAFQPQLPRLLPSGHYGHLPAISNWFVSAEHVHSRLNVKYLEQFADTIVPLELTAGGSFTRVHQPLSLLLAVANEEEPTPAQVYLAQATLSDLPARLREDVPTPGLVLTAGKGDIYDTSIWIGRAPTYTPLHRDPNPNLFVQLAGKKVVRMFSPDVGRAIFGHVQASIGGHGSATMRGEEMMQGEERKALEEAVWGSAKGKPWLKDGLECEVGAGDGLFIPKGWWHSIKGIGEGMTGSVNWWFR